ncbi:RES family NAD+ phosphorylase [Cellvibrio mixtus]|uniref:RES family NAD+ phosphorylase n=1 Tax=Cellvibrio mixtus TaxID=39650 RepID=UPI0005865E8A|nr:RES family NAD+ phosphorylase [Cellvibrio mixtus]
MNLADLLRPHIIGNCWRVVETQETAATMAITRSAAEQSRLEELLDLSKSKIPADCAGLSYLLMTPFRYPPLRYGSRFGSTWERGIFYGSCELQTAFAETAVYFWLFQQGLATLGPLENIRDQRTAFSVKLSSQKAIDLQTEEFAAQQDKIRQRESWDYTQRLGKQLREAGTEFVLYASSRFNGGKNIAVFSPLAFVDKEPAQQQLWHVRFTTENCVFVRAGNSESFEFHKNSFSVDGKIPHPALMA